MKPIIGVYGAVLLLGFGMLSTIAGAAAPGTPDISPGDEAGLCDTFTIQIDNDEMGGSDRHYTSGTRFACTASAPRFLEGWRQGHVPVDAITHHQLSYGIGQSVFTPDNIEERELIEDDQPYAGWLYLDFGLESEVIPASGDLRYVDNIGLQLGVIGPLSGAELFQRWTHDVLNATDPAGWDNQLDNEPGVNLFYSRQWTGAQDYALSFGDRAPSLYLDLTPEIGAALGNVHIYGAGGLTLRFGHFLPDDHGPPVIRPGLPGSDDFPKQNGWSAYLFGGLEGRIVGRNIFLDGNSFDSDSPSVDKNTLVGEAKVGVAVTFDHVRLTYTQVFRSQEFEDQSPQSYGAVTLSIGL